MNASCRFQDVMDVVCLSVCVCVCVCLCMMNGLPIEKKNGALILA